jgi:MFS family permease
LIVKVPHRILMPSLVLGWGIAQASMAACHNYSDLLAARFFLGLFEAGCLPLFGVITNQWYRRSEQPVRVAAWYGMNGMATIVASALSYGLGHIPSNALYSWQMYVRSFPTANIYTNLLLRYTESFCLSVW